jgi:superfamily I DNA/RNA helicase
MKVDEGKIEIINSSPDSRFLIEARPGVGKTFCILHRLNHLIKSGMNESEILIITFSRIATRILRDIFSDNEKSLDYDFNSLEISTIDSFIGKILHHIELFQTSTYDDNIIEFNEKIKLQNHDVITKLQEYKIFIVDEGQDIVGVRYKWLNAMLTQIESKVGFYIFYDQNQGIYNFTNQDETKLSTDLSENTFLNNTSKFEDLYRFKKVLMENNNKKNYRISNGNLLHLEIKLRKLLSSNSTYKQFIDKIKEIHKNDIVKSSDIVPVIANRLNQQQIAILTRNVYMLWSIFSKLCEEQKECFVIPSSSEDYIPDWLGRIFYDFRNTQISEKNFEEICLDRKISDCQDKWRYLILMNRYLTRKNQSQIKVETIRSALQRPYIREKIYEEKMVF